jgi:hypothetical protein
MQHTPKKCGTINGFMRNSLTNRDNVTYNMGSSLLNLWRICDGKRTLSDLTKMMSEEHTEAGYAPASIKEMLDLLETKKLINYPTKNSAA